MRVMFVACFESYVKHLTPSKWMLLLLLLWQSAHDNSLIENMFHICLRMGDWERQQEHPRLINVPKGLAVHIICLVKEIYLKTVAYFAAHAIIETSLKKCSILSSALNY